MVLSNFTMYLLIVNVVGFIFASINFLLYHFTDEGQIDKLVTLVVLLFGSLGVLLSILLFGRKIVKENLMSRVFIFTVFVIQIVILLFVKGHHAERITFAVWDFFATHKILVVYLLVINFIAFAMYAWDKISALEGNTRIRNVTLLGVAFIGGSLGGLIAVYLFHHKTQKDYYVVGLPLMIIMQVFVIFYLMNMK